jgi:predicted nucleic acid-binding protein
MILLDSSFLIAYLDERDKNHGHALKIQKDIDDGKYGTMIITDYIFDEVLTRMLRSINDIGKLAKCGDSILDNIDMNRVDENIFDYSWKIFKEQKGTRFSFTDCTNIAVCRTNGISAICTFDNEFTKMKDLNIISG